MRTHIELDDELLQQVLSLGEFPTKKAAVNAALRGYLNTLKRQQLLALRGQVAWQGDLQALRRARFDASDADETP
ncbi:MAG: hypothetical protein JWQ03_1035 [Variovorax sp.]|nr:hypothetical protein [Variovorax sp.]